MWNLPIVAINLKAKADQIEAEINRLRMKLDFIHELMEEQGSVASLFDRTNGSSNAGDGNGTGPDVTLKDAVHRIVASINVPFTKRNILERLALDYPHLRFNPKSIEKPFQTMVHLGDVEIAKRSYGSAPAYFKRRGI